MDRAHLRNDNHLLSIYDWESEVAILLFFATYSEGFQDHLVTNRVGGGLSYQPTGCV